MAFERRDEKALFFGAAIAAVEILGTLLAPIIFVMEMLFSAYQYLVKSTGVAILLLALTFALATRPLLKYGRRLERRIAEKNTGIQKAVREETAGLKGEAHFEVMEAVYRRHHFHPIQNMLSGASFIFQLPFLLSAIVLFIRDDFLQDKSFLWLADLSRPDGWLLVGNFAVNVLPMLVLVIGIYDAFVFYADDVAARRKFILIALVLFVLIFNMPSGLVLYWLALNICAMSRRA
ncbi:MAG: YidC/Oxa1 family membrane protein insertase [Candidatus Zeuxoniibacter abyssi]|nr:MAG: YidC/Oxa1 family membrane protein insertase [Candidatus Persebacteraceae bacterium AB1(2)]